MSKILNPLQLSRVTDTFRNLEQTIQTDGPWASAWVGESGGAFNSGARYVSDTFVNSFWYSFKPWCSHRYFYSYTKFLIVKISFLIYLLHNFSSQFLSV